MYGSVHSIYVWQILMGTKRNPENPLRPSKAHLDLIDRGKTAVLCVKNNLTRVSSALGRRRPDAIHRIIMVAFQIWRAAADRGAVEVRLSGGVRLKCCLLLSETA